MSNKLIQIPNDRQIWEGDIATYWFEQNILMSLSKPPKRSIELIKNNVALVKLIKNNTEYQCLQGFQPCKTLHY